MVRRSRRVTFERSRGPRASTTTRLDGRPDGALVAYASELSGWYELHVVGADGADARQLTHEQADLSEHRWHPDGDRLVAVRGRGGRFDLVLVDASSGDVTELARGGTWGDPQERRRARSLATYEDQSTAPQLRLVHAGSDPEVVARPHSARSPRRAARRAGGSDVHVVRRPRDPCVPLPPQRRVCRRAGRRRSCTRTAARSRPTATSGTATRSTSSTRATPGSRRTTAARPGTAASSSGCCTARSASSTRRTASPRPTSCARSTGSTVSGSASSARAGARSSRCSPSPTTRSTGSAAPSASTATATCSRPGRRATAAASSSPSRTS